MTHYLSPQAPSPWTLRPLSQADAAGTASPPDEDFGPAGQGQTVEEVERELVLRTLANHHGNRTTAARALGISVRTLRNKIRAYAALGIAVPAPLPKRLIEPYRLQPRSG